MFFKKKKEEVKPLPTLAEMKVKYKLFDSKVKEYSKNQQALADKHLQKATALRLKGLDASEEIKRVAFYQAKKRAAESRRDLLEMNLENYQAMEFDRQFLSTINDMAMLLGAVDIDSKDIENVAESIMQTNVKLASSQEKLSEKMNEIDAAFTSLDSLSGADSLKDVEESINAIIDRTISDASLSPEDVTVDDIAKSVSEKLKVEG